MAQCPKCGNNNATFKREVVGSTGSGSNVRVRVTKNVSVGSGGGNRKKQYRTIGFCPDCGYTWSQSKAGNNLLVKILLWLFIYIPFFPITLSVWFWKTPKLNLPKRKKAIILAVIWLILFIVGILTPSDNSEKQPSRGTSTAVTQETTTNKEVTTTSEASEEKEKKVDKKVEDEKESPSTNEQYLTDEIGIIYSDSGVPNDVTGNWREALCSTSETIDKYAYPYYQQYFSDDSEIHFIINFGLKTTNKLIVLGDVLQVTVYDYVENEEHDAKMLPSGTVLDEFEIDLASGNVINAE